MGKVFVAQAWESELRSPETMSKMNMTGWTCIPSINGAEMEKSQGLASLQNLCFVRDSIAKDNMKKWLRRIP